MTGEAAALRSLRLEQPVQHALRAARGGDDDALVRLLAAGELEVTLARPQTAALLERHLACDPDLETVLAALRRVLLILAPSPGEDSLRLRLVLAAQCVANEYVYWESAEETAAIADLETRLQARLDPVGLATYAMYRPLAGLAPATELSSACAGPLAAIFRRQVLEPERERALAAEIPSLTSIQDPVSQTVRARYEESPYPRWLALGTVDARSTRAGSILVAGCGTGRHALRTALRHPDASVLAIDLSARALAYGLRMARELGVANVEFAQADILELDGFERRFDRIEAIGVLHHLRDPVAGWRVLAGLLRPGGVLSLGLYSRLGRAPLDDVRRLLREAGLHDPAALRKARRMLASLPPGHPGRLPTMLEDFYATSSCLDLLFHVEENPLSLPEIEEALDSLGLEFLGFDRLPPGSPEPAPATLAEWNRFEEARPSSFLAMYRFSCRRPAGARSRGLPDGVRA